MIDKLQSLVPLKPDIPLLSIEKPIDQRGPVFTHALSPLVNGQLPSKSQRPTSNIYTRSDDGFFGSRKLTKALPNPSIFTNGKNPSIDW